LLGVSRPKYVLPGHLTVDMPCGPATSILSFKQVFNDWMNFILDILIWYSVKEKYTKRYFKMISVLWQLQMIANFEIISKVCIPDARNVCCRCEVLPLQMHWVIRVILQCLSRRVHILLTGALHHDVKFYVNATCFPPVHCNWNCVLTCPCNF